jgi:hypothetical protein
MPAAVLAWATPWVDLPAAVDFVSAPAIGLGYAFEAAAGLPFYGLQCWGRGSGASREERRAPSFVPPGFVVEHLAAEAAPRRPSPLPAEIGAYYEPPVGAAEDLRDRIERSARSSSNSGPITVRLDLGIDGELAYFRAGGAGSRRPLVLISPPTEGAFSSLYLARRFARRGVNAAVIVPDETFLEPRLDPEALEAKFRAGVVTARAILRALEMREEVDPRRIVYLGVSAGGIFGGVLIAVEPAIRRAVLVLPGGDLPRIIRESDERTVREYRAAWKAAGVSLEALSEEIERAVKTDPIRLARHVDPRRVLLFLGAWDTKVPVATGLALREGLGGPETYLLAGNHETASLCFGFILRRTEAFLFEEG